MFKVSTKNVSDISFRNKFSTIKIMTNLPYLIDRDESTLHS